MIAANGVTARVPRAAAASRRCGGCLRSPGALGPHRRARRQPRRTAAARAERFARCEAFLTARRAGRPGGLPGPVAFRRQAAGLGRVRGRAPRRVRRRALRPRREDYTHSDRAEPSLPGPGRRSACVKAARIAGRPSVTAEQLAELARHCTAAGGQRRRRWSVRSASPPPRSCSPRTWASSSTAIVTGASPKGTWVRIAHPAAEGRVVRGERGLDVGRSRFAWSWCTPTSSAASSTSLAPDGRPGPRPVLRLRA